MRLILSFIFLFPISFHLKSDLERFSEGLLSGDELLLAQPAQKTVPPPTPNDSRAVQGVLGCRFAFQHFEYILLLPPGPQGFC